MKLSPLTIILIGFSILVMALSYGFFQHFMPNTTEAGYYEAYAEQLDQEGNKLRSAENRLKEAEQLVETKAKEWRAVVDAKTPSTDVTTRGIDVSVDGWQLVRDSRKFRDNVQRAVNAQLIKGGVKVIGGGPSIPTPTDNAGEILASFYNYPAIAFPVTVFELGQVTVEGTYDQIMENVRSWKNMPHYLAVADGLTLTGTSPKLRGTYSVTIVGYIRGKKIFPPVPEGGAPAGGGTGGGQTGGFPAGPGGGRPGTAPPPGPGMMSSAPPASR